MLKENENTKDQEGTKSLLGARELLAIELRFEGYTYEKITEKINEIGDQDKPLIASSVRKWFMRGGKLYDLYSDHALTEAKIRTKLATEIFGAHTANAVRTLVEIMGSKSEHTPSRVKAAEAIINRMLGEPAKRLLDGETNVLDEYFERLKELRK